MYAKNTKDFYGNYCYANAPQCDMVHTLPFLGGGAVHSYTLKMETQVPPKLCTLSMKLHGSASDCDIHPFIGYIALYTKD
jgi:hypothetical protein